MESSGDVINKRYANLERVGKTSKALFFLAQGQEHPELPDVKIKRIWNGRDEGIELTTKKIEVKAIGKMLSSVKARIYQQY